MRWLPLVFTSLLVACYRDTEPTTLSNKVVSASVLEIRATAIGPIDAHTKVTLTDLRALLVGYEVRPFNDGSLQYDVFLGSEKLLYIVPDDNGGVFNIHAVSSKVAVDGHPWRVGSAFQDSKHIEACECWGPNPTCFKSGERVAVNFNRACDDLEGEDMPPRAFRVLDDLPVQRVIWSPKPFGDEQADRPDDGL